MKNSNKKGFTLVELIIVIAVIGVLAAILIPTFANAIEKANNSSRVSSARNAISTIVASLQSENAMAVTSAKCYYVADNGTVYLYEYDGEKLDTEAEKMTSYPDVSGAVVLNGLDKHLAVVVNSGDSEFIYVDDDFCDTLVSFELCVESDNNGDGDFDDAGERTIYDCNGKGTLGNWLRNNDTDGFTLDYSESSYGIYITSVNGKAEQYLADGMYYWSILVNNNYSMYGADSIVLHEGYTYTLQYAYYGW